MSDPLSVTAGVAGLAALALHGIRLLIDEMNNIREAPKSLENLRANLASVRSSLDSLKNVDEPYLKSLGKQVCDQTTAVIENCTITCNNFHSDLIRWTKRSHEVGKLSRRERINIGIFKERQIVAMGRQLQSCSSTLTSVAVTATLYTSIRNIANTEEIKEMLSSRQAEVTSTISAIDTETDEAERSWALLHASEDGQSSQQDEGDKESVARAINEELAMLRTSQQIMRSLIASMQAKLAECATGSVSNVSTSITFGGNNRGYQVGTQSGPISGLSFVSN